MSIMVDMHEAGMTFGSHSTCLACLSELKPSQLLKNEEACIIYMGCGSSCFVCYEMEDQIY